MADKEKKNQIADILLDFYDEYDSNVINRPMIPSIYTRKILNSLQEEPVSIWHDASEKSDSPEEVVIINPSDNTGEVVTRCIGVYKGRIWAYTSELLKLYNPYKIGKNLQEEPVNDKLGGINNALNQDRAMWNIENPVSEDLEEAIEDAMPDANWYIEENNDTTGEDAYNSIQMGNMFKAGAKWQLERVKEALLSEVLPCFMHGGEADEVVAKLDEVLNQKK